MLYPFGPIKPTGEQAIVIVKKKRKKNNNNNNYNYKLKFIPRRFYKTIQLCLTLNIKLKINYT